MVRKMNLENVEKGDQITVFYKKGTGVEESEVSGEMVGRYADHKIRMKSEDGEILIVNSENKHENDGVRNFETSELMGRFMFVEY